MAASAIGDVYMCTINGTLIGSRTMSTFYYQALELPPGATVTSVSAFISANINAAQGLADRYRDVCPSNWTYSQLWVQRVLPIRTIKTVFDRNQPGLSPNSATVSNVSASIKRQAEMGGRSSVGGIRVPLSPADCINGGLLGSALTNLQELATQMQASLFEPGTTLDAGFLREVIPPIPQVPFKEFQSTFQTAAQFTSRVMRRRGVGLGI